MTDSPEIRPDGETDTAKEADGGAFGAWDDLQIGFSGNPKAKIDDRGRLKMPAEFKAFIEKKYGKDFNAFYITSQDGETAEIFPMPEWQKLMGRILQMPRSSDARKRLMAVLSLYGDRADMDPQGRLVIPAELREKAELNGDVKVTGEGICLRVTNLRRLKESVQAKPLGREHMEELSQFGL